MFKVFTCETADRLSNVTERRGCGYPYGHPFSRDIRVPGPVENDTGRLTDFVDIDNLFKAVADQLDYHYQNEIERLSKSYWQTLHPREPARAWPFSTPLSEVMVYETCTFGCILKVEEDQSCCT